MDTSHDKFLIEVVVYIEKNELQSYPKLKNVKYIVGNLSDLPSMYNFCANFASGDIFFLAADDLIVKTRNWDKLIIDAYSKFNDTLLMIHGIDLGQNPFLFGTHFFLHRNWYETLGYLLPMVDGYFASDVLVSSISDNLCKRIIISDLVIEHLHPIWGKSKIDINYIEKFVREKETFERDFLFQKLSSQIEQVSNLLKTSIYYSKNFDSSPIVIDSSLERSNYQFKNSIFKRLANKVRWIKLQSQIKDYESRINSI